MFYAEIYVLGSHGMKIFYRDGNIYHTLKFIHSLYKNCDIVDHRTERKQEHMFKKRSSI